MATSAKDHGRTSTGDFLVRRSGLLSAVAVIAPFLLAGAVYGFTGHLVLGGDQALLALDALDARHLEQFVGPYSRMGWAHPGPVWLYLLSAPFWLVGSTGPALVFGVMAVHALFAGLLVAAAGSSTTWSRPLMAVLVLLYVLRMPSVDFVSVWNPFALLLPTVLLLLLAARAARGSASATAGAALVASFLLQSHVGTVPLVGLVMGVALVALVVHRVRGTGTTATEGDRRLLVAGCVGLVLVWFLPVWQQLRSDAGQGNLYLLLSYFTGGSTDVGGSVGRGWDAAFSALGQLVAAPVFGLPATPQVIDTTLFPLAVVLGGLVVTLGAFWLAVAARRAGEHAVEWQAWMVGCAATAGLAAAKVATGELYNYLVLWVTALPVVLTFAVLSWVGSDAAAERSHRFGWTGGTAVRATVALGLLSGMVFVALDRASSALPDQPGVADAAAIAVAGLPPADQVDGVRLDIGDGSAWTTATGVALRLEQEGFRVTVDREWVYSFGEDRASSGNESWQVSIASTDATGLGPAVSATSPELVAGPAGPLAVSVTPNR